MIVHECFYQLTFYHYHCFFYLKSASKKILKLISDRKSNGNMIVVELFKYWLHKGFSVNYSTERYRHEYTAATKPEVCNMLVLLADKRRKF